MQNELELQRIIFDLMVMQIKFGVYRCGDSLPTIKEAAGFFWTSVDTVRSAYVHLKREGYISLSTYVGASVTVQYSTEEIQAHIQTYFACRKHAILDLAQSALPLFGHAQWLAFTNASPETLDELERSNQRKDIPTLYRMSQQYLLLYSALGNEAFMRLVWQIFLFSQAPFFSIPHNITYFLLGAHPPRDVLSEHIRLCREKNWAQLRQAIAAYEDRRYHALCRFYETEIQPEPDTAQVAFTWSPYKKTSQLLYSLCMDLMVKIRAGDYPEGSFLPSMHQLAREKQVSLNTARRTLGLMQKLGAAESINRVGTKVLSPFDCANHCDFHDDTIQKRLLDFARCMHIFALSCRACSACTIASMDADTLHEWIELLASLKQTGIYEDVIITCYSFIATHAPYEAIRTVYTQLTQQLLWGAPLQRLHREGIRAHFGPYLNTLLDYLSRADGEGFSKTLEDLQTLEMRLTVPFLVQLKVQDAAELFLF